MKILSSQNHNFTIASIILLIKIFVPSLDHFLFILLYSINGFLQVGRFQSIILDNFSGLNTYLRLAVTILEMNVFAAYANEGCVVISPEEMNASLGTVIVAPMTSTARAIPTRVKICAAPENGLTNDSYIALDQIKTIGLPAKR